MVFGFIISFIVTFLLIPIIIRFAEKRNIGMYIPDHSIHESYVPTLGGVGMFLGFFAGLFVLFQISGIIGIHLSSQLLGFASGACIILLEGIYDDIKGANYFKKFVCQIAASVIVILYGYRIDFIANPFGGDLSLGIFAVPITVLWITGITNAFNLIDGLDGLAAGIGSIISVTFIAITYAIGDFTGLIMSVLLLGTTLAFLWYNFNPAKVFMGDVGSQFIGFVFACISINSFFSVPNSPAVFIPLIALGVPIIDTVLVFFRRICLKKHPFKGDKSHIHHYLLGLNLGYKKTVFIIYAVTLLFGITSFLFILLAPVYIAPLLIAGFIILAFLLYKIGYLHSMFSANK